MTDWVAGGWDVPEAVELCRMLAARGDVDLIDCTSGGNRSGAAHPASSRLPGAVSPRRFGARPASRRAAVGLISSPEMAEEILANGRADLVVIGRMLLFDPNWPLHAANVLKARGVAWPVQYERANIF